MASGGVGHQMLIESSCEYSRPRASSATLCSLYALFTAYFLSSVFAVTPGVLYIRAHNQAPRISAWAGGSCLFLRRRVVPRRKTNARCSHRLGRLLACVMLVLRPCIECLKFLYQTEGSKRLGGGKLCPIIRAPSAVLRSSVDRLCCPKMPIKEERTTWMPRKLSVIIYPSTRWHMPSTPFNALKQQKRKKSPKKVTSWEGGWKGRGGVQSTERFWRTACQHQASACDVSSFLQETGTAGDVIKL